MPCSSSPAFYSSTSSSSPVAGECAAQSLVKALDRFLKEVQDMRDVVMVPSRLRGVPVHQPSPCKALLAVGPGALVPYCPPGSLGGHQLSWPDDLYRRFRVVEALRRELTADRATVGQGEDENDDEQTRLMAAHFRTYLAGLFDVLQQLTDMSRHVADWYQQQVNGKKPL